MPSERERPSELSRAPRKQAPREPDVSSASHRARPSRSASARAAWAALGSLFVGLGALGLLVPGLPTTPFLLLAAACFARSSQRLYDRLLANRLFGPAVREFRDGRGVPLRAKVLATSTMAVFVLFAVLVAIPREQLAARVAVALAGLIGSVVVLRLPTRREP